MNESMNGARNGMAGGRTQRRSGAAHLTFGIRWN
jgi:hypothetical protein